MFYEREALPGVVGNRAFVSGEQGSKGLKTVEQRQIKGQETQDIKIFIFGEREQNDLFQGRKETGTPLGGPHEIIF